MRRATERMISQGMRTIGKHRKRENILESEIVKRTVGEKNERDRTEDIEGQLER